MNRHLQELNTPPCRCDEPVIDRWGDRCETCKGRLDWPALRRAANRKRPAHWSFTGYEAK